MAFLFVLLFLIAFITLELCAIAFRGHSRSDVRERLKGQYITAQDAVIPDLEKRQALSGVPFVSKLLLSIPFMKRLNRYVAQANVRFPLGFYVMLVPFLVLLGYTFSSLVTGWLISGLMGALLGIIPVFYIGLKRKRRAAKFERQLPDALDLIARSLRAGHAFSSGLALAAEEFEDPLSTQFRITIDEINFGVSVPAALRNLADRVDSKDLWFFVASATLQREVGGNLSEVMETISHIIRERFRLKGKIMVLTGEVRLSGVMLMVLPFLVFGLIGLINPEHMSMLIYRPEGRLIGGITLALMAAGYLIMRRIMVIRV